MWKSKQFSAKNILREFNRAIIYKTYLAKDTLLGIWYIIHMYFCCIQWPKSKESFSNSIYIVAILKNPILHTINFAFPKSFDNFDNFECISGSTFTKTPVCLELQWLKGYSIKKINVITYVTYRKLIKLSRYDLTTRKIILNKILTTLIQTSIVNDD